MVERMRLIDADAFIEYVNRGFDLCSDELRMMIEEQPTAYDVDKVVEELEEMQIQANKNMQLSDTSDKANGYGGQWLAYGLTIPIVKRGGVK